MLERCFVPFPDQNRKTGDDWAMGRGSCPKVVSDTTHVETYTTSLMLTPTALSLSFLLLQSSLAARFSQALPDDLHAFPKYRVTFLNGLPLLNDTAQKWLADGLRGGELEFLDKPWTEDTTRPFTSIKGIDSGSTLDNASPASVGTTLTPFTSKQLILLTRQNPRTVIIRYTT